MYPIYIFNRIQSCLHETGNVSLPQFWKKKDIVRKQMTFQILNNSSNLFSSIAAQVIQKVVTGQRRVQYSKYFPSFWHFTIYFKRFYASEITAIYMIYTANYDKIYITRLACHGYFIVNSRIFFICQRKHIKLIFFRLFHFYKPLLFAKSLLLFLISKHI